MSLTFNPRNHTYRLDGKHVPGVTTLLGDGLPKPALVRWAAKSVAEYVADNYEQVEALRGMPRDAIVAALKQVPWSERDEAAVRGTDVHDIAEKVIHGEAVDVPEHLVGPVEGYVRWLDEWQPQVIWTERPVASRRWWYAGKPDAIVTIGADVWLLDWKTAKGVYGDNALQVAAYANAEFYVDDDGNEHDMPKVDRLGVVHIQPDRTDLYEVSDPAAAWKDAQHVFWTAKAKKRIGSYLGDAPLVAPTPLEVIA